ncbi:hypothetical protein [Pseudomonas aeruginosa]|uniref:hypothetical protein n=1 Tax=Pseudomonas aeruginosa TaxID=287 RepID=UPI00155E2137|nr:hypothetical protein [Pseudomonas aeruginosa]NRC34052.1 hypothetical protein [Pseudomonas aeruginosa]
MDKRELKKQILAQLAGYLQREVIIDGLHGADVDKCHEVQAELASEFKRRSRAATNQASN